MPNEELVCHQFQTRAAQAGDPESQGSTPAPAAQGETSKPLGTFWHPPHLIFLLGVSSVMKFFLSSKNFAKLYSQVQFSIYMCFTFITVLEEL